MCPILEALGRGPIVEIGVGAATGDTTEKLAPLATSLGTVLHVVEPEPELDVVDFERRFGELETARTEGAPAQSLSEADT